MSNKPNKTTPTQPQPTNSLSFVIPELKPKNKRGENPKSQGIYFIYSKEMPKTEEETIEQKGYSLIPKIKEVIGSNNLKALIVATMETYYEHLKVKGVVKVEEEKKPES